MKQFKMLEPIIGVLFHFIGFDRLNEWLVSCHGVRIDMNQIHEASSVMCKDVINHPRAFAVLAETGMHVSVS